MAEEPIVYIRQHGEQPIPVTARIEWLSDGSIKPCLYWTPDGGCYTILPDYKCVMLAHLKDKAEGLRYTVHAEPAETLESGYGRGAVRQDAYLYFADNRFCGRNFIDGRYGHAGKEYIPVTMDVFPNGDYELCCFWVKGLRYTVEKTIAVEPRSTFRAGGVGLYHKVKARQVNADNDDDPNPEKSIRRTAGLYFEVNKWFVAVGEGDSVS